MKFEEFFQSQELPRLPDVLGARPDLISLMSVAHGTLSLIFFLAAFYILTQLRFHALSKWPKTFLTSLACLCGSAYFGFQFANLWGSEWAGVAISGLAFAVASSIFFFFILPVRAE